MRRRSVGVLVAVLLAGLLAAGLVGGCRGGDRAAASAERAHDAYRRAIAALAGDERAALAALAAATGEGFRDDDALLATLRGTVLPRYRQFVDGLRAVQPPEGELARLHGRLAELAARELALLERLERAVDTGDGTAVLYVNQEQLALGRELDGLADELVAAIDGTPGGRRAEAPARAGAATTRSQ